jgi:aryl-alcohol dehydrogenase-like predicted oxidoreductase
MSAAHMRIISIPGVPNPVSQLVMGSMMLTEENIEEAVRLLDAYIATGGNSFDTAHAYGHSTMRAIGIWMQERKNRSGLTIIGKGAHPDQLGSRMTRQAMNQDLDESLDALMSDYVDVFMLHRDDPYIPVGEILETLQELLESKRCLAIGVSNWKTARIEEANDYAAANGLTGFCLNSPNLSLAKPNEPRWRDAVSADQAYAAWHERVQLPLLSWSSQAGGFFTGRFSPDKREDPDAVRVYYNEGNWERYRRANLLAERKGCDANQVALAFVLHQRFPTCAIIGPNSVAELQSSVKALEVSLAPEEVSWLDLEIENL